MDVLGIGFLVTAAILGSVVFFVLLQNSVILNPSLQGMFSWWLGCVVGTGFAIGVAFLALGSLIEWGIEFFQNHYKIILGVVVALGVLGAMGGKKKPSATEPIENAKNDQ